MTVPRQVAWRSAETFRDLLEAAPDGMLGVDASGIIQVANRQAELLFGYPREELLGMPVEILVPEPARGVHARHRAVYATHPRTRPMGAALELTALRKDGTRFPASISLAAMSTETGMLFIAAVRDVTEQAAAQRLAAIIEHADDAIFDQTADGIITSWNKAAERLYGYRADQVTGKPATFLTDPGRQEELLRSIRNTRATGQVTRADTIGLRKDGTQVEVAVTISPVTGPAGAVTRLATIAQDITARKHTERMLAERTRQLEASNRELTQFAYVASHDLQEPLRKVTAFCQLLADRYAGQLDEQADEYISYAVDGAIRMQQLINDLLALSRVGKLSEQTEDVDCNEVMRHVLQDLATAIQETGAQVTVSTGMPVVRGQQTLLEQLFGNLISNAIKFHGAEPPRVDISAVRDGGDWQFAVADNGIGIEPQYSERIFVVFQRLHSRAEYRGTGIGLAVCKKVVESFGGRIWLESAPGNGATFYWTMPAGPEQS